MSSTAMGDNVHLLLEVLLAKVSRGSLEEKDVQVVLVRLREEAERSPVQLLQDLPKKDGQRLRSVMVRMNFFRLLACFSGRLPTSVQQALDELRCRIQPGSETPPGSEVTSAESDGAHRALKDVLAKFPVHPIQGPERILFDL
mmetsp:Transcript_23545/g.54689  ORF Transcript_23545/g.54689 Transcript_23545/m.54689 type:complete len:143 (+) Transcript_23545:225-653(+)